MANCTILIIDDHTLLRETWVDILNAHPGYQVVAQCGTTLEAMQLCAAYKPDLIILDINLPDGNGIDLARALRHISPVSNILAVSFYSQSGYVKKIMQNGALGYLTKNATRAEFFTALEHVAEGKKYISEEIKNLLANQLFDNQPTNRLNKLSSRELEVVELLKKGCSSKEIAEKLIVSLKTIEVHRYNILKKFELKNTAALINHINLNSQF